MGDFNYRIALDNDKVRKLIRNNDIDGLYRNDQAQFFPITPNQRLLLHPPTNLILVRISTTHRKSHYSDVLFRLCLMFRSEKARVPGWTDRILLKGGNTRQINYNSVPLQLSDHRPVYGIFLCTISIVDEIQKEALSRQIFKERKAQINGTLSNIKDITYQDSLKKVSSESDLLSDSSNQQDLWLNGSHRLNSQNLSQRKLSIPEKLNHSIIKSQKIIKPQISPRKPPNRPLTHSGSATWNTPTNSRKFAKNVPAVIQIRGLSKNLETEDSKKYNLNDDQIVGESCTLPNHVNSDRSKVFTSASAKGQAPPPIARKPSHLSSTLKVSSQNSAISSSNSKHSNEHAPPSLPNAINPRYNKSHSKVEEKKAIEPPPLPQPRDSGKGIRVPPLPPKSRRVGNRTKDSPSPLQPKNVSKETRQVSKGSDVSNKNLIKSTVPDRKKSPATLLESDIESSISSWEVLEPENKQMR